MSPVLQVVSAFRWVLILDSRSGQLPSGHELIFQPEEAALLVLGDSPVSPDRYAYAAQIPSPADEMHAQLSLAMKCAELLAVHPPAKGASWLIFASDTVASPLSAAIAGYGVTQLASFTSQGAEASSAPAGGEANVGSPHTQQARPSSLKPGIQEQPKPRRTDIHVPEGLISPSKESKSLYEGVGIADAASPSCDDIMAMLERQQGPMPPWSYKSLRKVLEMIVDQDLVPVADLGLYRNRAETEAFFEMRGIGLQEYLVPSSPKGKHVSEDRRRTQDYLLDAGFVFPCPLYDVVDALVSAEANGVHLAGGDLWRDVAPNPSKLKAKLKALGLVQQRAFCILPEYQQPHRRSASAIAPPRPSSHATKVIPHTPMSARATEALMPAPEQGEQSDAAVAVIEPPSRLEEDLPTAPPSFMARAMLAAKELGIKSPFGLEDCRAILFRLGHEEGLRAPSPLVSPTAPMEVFDGEGFVRRSIVTTWTASHPGHHGVGEQLLALLSSKGLRLPAAASDVAALLAHQEMRPWADVTVEIPAPPTASQSLPTWHAVSQSGDGAATDGVLRQLGFALEVRVAAPDFWSSFYPSDMLPAQAVQPGAVIGTDLTTLPEPGRTLFGCASRTGLPMALRRRDIESVLTTLHEQGSAPEGLPHLCETFSDMAELAKSDGLRLDAVVTGWRPPQRMAVVGADLNGMLLARGHRYPVLAGELVVAAAMLEMESRVGSPPGQASWGSLVKEARHFTEVKPLLQLGFLVEPVLLPYASPQRDTATVVMPKKPRGRRRKGEEPPKEVVKSRASAGRQPASASRQRRAPVTPASPALTGIGPGFGPALAALLDEEDVLLPMRLDGLERLLRSRRSAGMLPADIAKHYVSEAQTPLAALLTTAGYEVTHGRVYPPRGLDLAASST